MKSVDYDLRLRGELEIKSFYSVVLIKIAKSSKCSILVYFIWCSIYYNKLLVNHYKKFSIIFLISAEKWLLLITWFWYLLITRYNNNNWIFRIEETWFMKIHCFDCFDINRKEEGSSLLKMCWNSQNMIRLCCAVNYHIISCCFWRKM